LVLISQNCSDKRNQNNCCAADEIITAPQTITAASRIPAWICTGMRSTKAPAGKFPAAPITFAEIAVSTVFQSMVTAVLGCTMADKSEKGVIQIESGAGTASEPAHVSILIDGDRKYTVRTSDLENIGAQLRGRKSFSVFNSVGLPIMISVLTVIVTTLIGQTFQYVSWRNSIALQKATSQAQKAVEAFDKASLAVSQRYYATFLYLDATRDLANRKTDVDSKLYKMDLDLNQQRFKAFYQQLKSWNENYDQMLTNIDYSLDGSVLGKHERVSAASFDKKFNCNEMLISELQRLNLNIYSLKLQFAALNYCFLSSIKDFGGEKEKAIADNTFAVSDKTYASAVLLNINIHSMSNEFRCFGQQRIRYLERRKQAAIFRLSTWIHDKFAEPVDTLTAHLKQTSQECDFTPKK
jgi:hypothetical protein